MNRVYNFAPGPSALPLPVLEKAQAELLDYKGCGMSVMEISHRSPEFEEIINGAQSSLRRLLKIPENFHILFLQGGASTQFAAVPMNLMTKNGKADYLVTGQFAKKAFQEAKRYGDVVAAASSEDKTYSYIPSFDVSSFRPDTDYIHICFNNTIYGTKYRAVPEVPGIPLVADMSSSILSEPVDFSKYGLVYAGAQKNLGPAGVTLVIVRDDLVGEPMAATPTMLRYDIEVKENSLYNTPPAFGIYMCRLVLDYLEELGGIDEMERRNHAKAALLYGFLDSSKLFKPCAEKAFRSYMNVTFVTGSADLDAKFVKEAKAAGLVNLKGHRSVGGMRASIYNAMPMEGVEKLVAFMQKFETENA